MGLLREGINEVIATTAFNAAPMGIRYGDGNYSLTLFSGSHTASNVERDRWLVANILFDPVLYVKTAFEDLSKEAFCEEEVNGKTVQRLKAAEAWVVFSAKVGLKTAEATQVSLIVERESVASLKVRPVNRGFNSIIDATIHATRYIISHDAELMRLIDYHSVIIRKCGGPREREALELLGKYLQ